MLPSDVIETDPGRLTLDTVARKGFSEDKIFELRLRGRGTAGQEEHLRHKKWKLQMPGDRTGFHMLEHQEGPVWFKCCW